MVNVDPKIYENCFVLEKLVKVIYVKIQKSLYGLLYNSLLFHFQLAIDLKIIVCHKFILTVREKKWSRGKC